MVPRRKSHVYGSYEEYRSAQIKASERKLAANRLGHRATDGALTMVADFIKANIKTPIVKGICHGAHNGWEVNMLMSKIENAMIVGTDIAPAADRYFDLIRADFHDNLFENEFHFVYSNSLDCAIDPDRALMAWRKSLLKDGLVVVEWTPFHDGEPNEVSCFMAPAEVYLTMMNSIGPTILTPTLQTMNADNTSLLPMGPIDFRLLIMRT